MQAKCIKKGRRLLLAGVLVLLASSAQAVERLKLATQLWPPYQTLEDGRIGGIAVERVQCALRRMRQPYELRMMPWDKAQLLVETNQMHGFFAGSTNSVRARYSEASIPVISLALTWFIAPGVTLDMNDESSKYQARYSAKFNTNKWLYLKKNGFTVVKKPRDADVLLKMLWQGDIDVALEYEKVFEYSLKKEDIPADYFRRVPYSKRDQNVHFSKEFIRQNPNFLGTFNKALAKCIKG